MASNLANFFGSYALAVAILLSAAIVSLLPRRSALVAITVLAIWIGYTYAIGRSGIAADHDRIPPGIMILIGPAFALVLGIGLSAPGRFLAPAVPLWLLVGFQTFRVGVEYTLTSLTKIGLAPHLLTLESGNFEVLIAITAPLAAFVAYRRPAWRKALIAWNVLGLVSLANVAARAVLTAPGPLNLIPANVPDVAITMYPFTFIPGCMAPLAVLLHILSLRAIASRSPDVFDHA